MCHRNETENREAPFLDPFIFSEMRLCGNLPVFSSILPVVSIWGKPKTVTVRQAPRTPEMQLGEMRRENS